MAYAVDLFCGAGGMSEGILQAGFHILFSSDINEDVEKTYVNRHEQLGYHQGYNTYFHRGDIRELNGDFILDSISKLEFFKDRTHPRRIDAIFGGPPCQGFSRAGKRDPNDPRNMLFREYLRVINEIRPRYVVMENVEGFTDTKLTGFIGVTGEKYEDDSLVPDILVKEFNLLGYDTLVPKVLDASDYGVPQRRKRIIFIAYERGERVPSYPTPITTGDRKLTLLDAIGDLIVNDSLRDEINPHLTQYQTESIEGRTPNVEGVPINSDGKKLNFELSKHLPLIKERFSLFEEGEDTVSLKKRILNNGIDLGNKTHLVQMLLNGEDKLTHNDIIQKFAAGNVEQELLEKILTKKNARTKLHRAQPSLTVLTLPDDYISPFENRIFSVRELARLQSFDDSFLFLGKRTTGGDRRKIEVPQYSQVGNAVPPLLAKAVAKEIIKVL